MCLGREKIEWKLGAMKWKTLMRQINERVTIPNLKNPTCNHSVRTASF